MAGNKHALTRYRVLDACFSNWVRKYYVEDLIELCSEALLERYPSKESGISRRTFFDDINDLDEIVSEYGIEILRINDGKKKYYRYSQENFTLFAKGFTEEELKVLRNNIQTLQRFKGIPTFQWMDSLINKLEDKLTLKSSISNIIDYDENVGYSGIEWLKDCFSAIVEQQPITIEYRSFEDREFQWTIHPYYIKQYNNRWFLIGLNPEYANLSTIPLDRIDDITPLHVPFIENTAIDFDRYFDTIIGVTLTNNPVEKVLLRFSPERIQYVLTKPIHKSQICSNPESGIVTLRLIPNRELEALLLSFGPDVEVLEPAFLRERIQTKVMKSYETYFSVHSGCTEAPYICNIESEQKN